MPEPAFTAEPPRAGLIGDEEGVEVSPEDIEAVRFPPPTQKAGGNLFTAQKEKPRRGSGAFQHRRPGDRGGGSWGRLPVSRGCRR
jgi:hypothetical protein